MGYFEGFIGDNLWTALFVLLNTLAVIFVATKFLFKPVMKIIEDRQNEIDDIYAAAGQAQDEANTMREEYAEKLADAQATSERMVKSASGSCCVQSFAGSFCKHVSFKLRKA